MDQKPQNSKDRSTRRMDGLGSSAASRKTSAPLDLRNASSARSAREAVSPQSAPANLPSAPSQPQAPKGPTVPPTPPTSNRVSHYDDPLHGLIDDDLRGPQQSQQLAPVSDYAPVGHPKKRTFWHTFKRFLVVLLILLFIVSAGLFIYLSYFQVQ